MNLRVSGKDGSAKPWRSVLKNRRIVENYLIQIRFAVHTVGGESQFLRGSDSAFSRRTENCAIARRCIWNPGNGHPCAVLQTNKVANERVRACLDTLSRLGKTAYAAHMASRIDRVGFPCKPFIINRLMVGAAGFEPATSTV